MINDGENRSSLCLERFARNLSVCSMETQRWGGRWAWGGKEEVLVSEGRVFIV